MLCPTQTSRASALKRSAPSSVLSVQRASLPSKRVPTAVNKSEGRAIAHSQLSPRFQRMTCRTAEVVDAPTEVAEAPATGASAYADAIVLQGFGWDSCEKGGWFKQLQDRIPEMVAAGVTHVWLPPPSQSVAPQGYMPGQLYNLTSKYGTKEELIALNKALKEAGLKPIADIVINHRCADEQVDGVWNKFRDDVTHDGRKIDWGQWAITGNDPEYNGTGNPDTGDDYGPAPDLDHLNPELQKAIIDWLQWLQNDIGFEAWRLDFSKGYGAEFVNKYVSATVGGDVLNIGEYWTDLHWEGSSLGANQDAARQTIVDWINNTGKTSCAFDFPLKGILQEAIKNCEYWRLKDSQGKAPGAAGWMPSRVVTFIANHDTDSTQQHWPFPANDVCQGYAYILTHPGIPCLFWDHVMTWGDDVRNTVKELVQLRKRNGINSRSKLEILAADHDMYVARIDDRVVIKMGPKVDMGDLVPNKADGWCSSSVKGNNFAVWEKNVEGSAAA